MPHGTPDWGLVGPKKTTYGLDDLGEHAVRLGSPVLWDRRGDVLVADAFDRGLGEWNWNYNGTGADVQLWTGENRQGAYCVNLVAGKTTNGWAGISRAIPYAVRSRIGLEASVGLDADTSNWQWAITWRDGAWVWDARMRYDFQNQVLQYYDDAAAWQTFATGVKVRAWSGAWSTGKLVVDLTTQEYVRALFADHEYDLSAYGIVKSTTATVVELTVSLIQFGVLGANPEGKVDSVIVTRNEP